MDEPQRRRSADAAVLRDRPAPDDRLADPRRSAGQRRGLHGHGCDLVRDAGRRRRVLRDRLETASACEDVGGISRSASGRAGGWSCIRARRRAETRDLHPRRAGVLHRSHAARREQPFDHVRGRSSSTAMRRPSSSAWTAINPTSSEQTTTHRERPQRGQRRGRAGRRPSTARLGHDRQRRQLVRYDRGALNNPVLPTVRHLDATPGGRRKAVSPSRGWNGSRSQPGHVFRTLDGGSTGRTSRAPCPTSPHGRGWPTSRTTSTSAVRRLREHRRLGRARGRRSTRDPSQRPREPARVQPRRQAARGDARARHLELAMPARAPTPPALPPRDPGDAAPGRGRRRRLVGRSTTSIERAALPGRRLRTSRDRDRRNQLPRPRRLRRRELQLQGDNVGRRELRVVPLQLPGHHRSGRCPAPSRPPSRE